MRYSNQCQIWRRNCCILSVLCLSRLGLFGGLAREFGLGLGLGFKCIYQRSTTVHPTESVVAQCSSPLALQLEQPGGQGLSPVRALPPEYPVDKGS